MKKKIAGATRSLVAMITALSAILAILILPVYSASPNEYQSEAKEIQESTSDLSSETVSHDPLIVTPSDPIRISGAIDGALSAFLFANTLRTQENSQTDNKLPPYVPLNPEDAELFVCDYDITPQEYEMMLYCVDHETRSGSLYHRIMIAEVIMRRVLGPKFGSTVSEVLLKKGQFSVMTRWEQREGWVPKSDTVEAVNLVLSGRAPDLAPGAVYFCNPYIVGEGNWFDTSLQAICELEGHRFYKPY